MNQQKPIILVCISQLNDKRFGHSVGKQGNFGLYVENYVPGTCFNRKPLCWNVSVVFFLFVSLSISYDNVSPLTSLKMFFLHSLKLFPHSSDLILPLITQTGKLVRLSQQELVDCSWGFQNNGCDGGEDFRAYHYLLANGGLSSEDQYGQYLGIVSKKKLLAWLYELMPFLNRPPLCCLYTKCFLNYPIKVYLELKRFLFNAVQCTVHQGRTTVKHKDIGCQWRLASRNTGKQFL